MPITTEISLKDKDGFHYKHPNRNCKLTCMKYPCIKGMEILNGNFAAYGCLGYSDVNTFVLHKTENKK